MDESTTIGLVEDNGEIGSNANTSENPETHMPQSFPSTSEAVEKTQGARKNYKRTANRGRKGSQVLASRKCSLRSPQDNVRALRSLSNVKKAPNESVDTPIQPAAKRRKRARPSKRSPKNEYLTIRQRVRYILNRMSYEQSLIEAYASEGWKGQSLEKVRPEKELERAKAEILRCKLRIREAFQNIDSLLSDGKLEESLFDSAGEISSEDIFCAKCCSKDVTLSNDIILCDGVCDRGFHQNCLDPPLLTEDIPAGDEGWLCPACDCKIDCIDVLNELQGSDLSIHDSWEKVFPEVAVLANGLKQNDTSDLPSEDSDDNDYDPNMAEEHVVDQEKEGSSEEDEDEGSDSDDSNFTGSSENSEPPKDKKTGDDLGLPSEDSEDDDYDPAVPDSDKDIKKHQSSSDKSDFTSDLDDFCAEITKSCGQADVSTPLSGVKAVDNASDTARDTIDTQAKAANSNVTSMETELNQDVILPVSRRRQIERLDYKKLYDEAYGKASPDSSDDDEDWCGKSTPQKDNKQESETDSPAQKSSRTAGVALQNGLTPQSAHQCLPPAALDGSVGEQRAGELTSNGSNSTAQKRHFGPTISQRLQEHFKTDPYPTRTTKETLAQEIGLTYRQVNKWFESTRHYTRVATAKNLENHTTKKNSCSETMMEQLNVGRNDITNEETMARNLNESSKQDSPVKQDINYEHGVVLALFSNQSPASTSRKVGRPRGGFRKNLG